MAAKYFYPIASAMSRIIGPLRLTHENALTVRESRGEDDMKYILMMGGTKKGWESMYTWPKEDVQAHIQFMIGFSKELGASGELISAEGLATPDQAKVVRAGNDGTPITDGVFPESKEFLAGWWIVDVENPERAIAIAAKASAAPGPGGKPLNMPIEVRQVMAGPPEEFL
jgi:hypothetical protein